MNYAEKLKEIRTNRELTQKQVADALNISRSAYSDFENQISIIPIKKLVLLSEYYNLSIDYLLGLNDIEQYSKITKVDNKNAGNRLKEFRKEKKLTQKKLGEILNISYSNIKFYEQGRNLIATPFLYTICKKYNISADYLLGKIDNPKYLNK